MKLRWVPRVGGCPGGYFSASPAQSETIFHKEVVTRMGKLSPSKLLCGLCPVANRTGRGQLLLVRPAQPDRGWSLMEIRPPFCVLPKYTCCSFTPPAVPGILFLPFEQPVALGS